MTIYSRARILLAFTLLLFLFCSGRVRGGEVTLAWNASPSLTTAGYELYYGLASSDYSSNLDTGTNLTATITGLTPGVTYYFAVAAYDTNGDVGALSDEITNRLQVLPSLVAQPLTQTVIAGTSVTLAASVVGDPPLSFQWMDGLAPIAGGTASSLSWLQIGSINAGNYSVRVTNPWGSATSSIATVTVLTPPSITKQPQSQTIVATTGASFSSSASGTAPLSIQWYCGTKALAGATNSSLSWASVAASNGGNYQFTVSNAAGVVTSSVATLTVLASNTFASMAGVYNGLFFQTNANGTAAVTEASAGFLGNCVVAANGTFSAKLYVGGLSYSWSGNFDSSGNHDSMVGNSSTLAANLQLNLTNGAQQMTGTVSSTAPGNAWTDSLVADLATNAAPQLTEVIVVMPPALSIDASANYGAAAGVVVNGVITFSGVLGDSVTFSQTVPICKNGFVPIYASLYNNSGLVEGWINVSGGGVTGNLTWIRPSGVSVPAGYPQGFDTVVNVTGSTVSN